MGASPRSFAHLAVRPPVSKVNARTNPMTTSSQGPACQRPPSGPTASTHGPTMCYIDRSVPGASIGLGRRGPTDHMVPPSFEPGTFPRGPRLGSPIALPGGPTARWGDVANAQRLVRRPCARRSDALTHVQWHLDLPDGPIARDRVPCFFSFLHVFQPNSI